MELAIIVLNQTVTMFILMAIGYTLYKLQIISNHCLPGKALPFGNGLSSGGGSFGHSHCHQLCFVWRQAED